MTLIKFSKVTYCLFIKTIKIFFNKLYRNTKQISYMNTYQVYLSITHISIFHINFNGFCIGSGQMSLKICNFMIRLNNSSNSAFAPLGQPSAFNNNCFLVDRQIIS